MALHMMWPSKTNKTRAPVPIFGISEGPEGGRRGTVIVVSRLGWFLGVLR